MRADLISLKNIIKWPLRPFVRSFVKMQNWYQYRKPQIMYQLFWKPRGYSWVEYYAIRLDQYVDVNAYASDRFEKYVSEAQEQAIALKKYGLLPQDTLLDYGCGSLRVGYYLINYLDPNKYVGIDISSKRLNKGIAYLTSKGIDPNRYQTFTVADCSLKEVNHIKFDVVWAHSVFTHMPRSDISQLLEALKSRLHPTSRFLFTFSHNFSIKAAQMQRPMKKSKIIGKDYYHTFNDMKMLCEQAGYDYKVLDEAWPVSFSALAEIRLKNHNTL